MAILIAYYSRAGENYFGGSYRRIPVGNTRRVAEQLASLTGGDLLELRQAHPYSDDYRTCVAQARADWQQSVRPELLGLPKDLAGYDRIYLGYPNYCGTMPMAVYTFLEHYDFTGKVICPFCTHEGSGLSQTEQDIRKAAPGATVTRGLAIHGSHVDEAAPALWSSLLLCWLSASAVACLRFLTASRSASSSSTASRAFALPKRTGGFG